MKTYHRAVQVLCLGLVFLAVGCSTAPQSNVSGSAVSESVVSISGFAFHPPATTVKAGTTVTWTNNDSTAHTVTADDGSFDSGQIVPGGTYTHTFTQTELVSYHCSNHPSMRATVSAQ